LPGLVWNNNSPDFSLLSSLVLQVWTTSIGLLIAYVPHTMLKI
jgi:hypothetical protein